MQSIATLIGSDLVWQKRNWRKQAFDLYAGNDVIATVSWENWQQTKAIAEIGNKFLRFERQGFWRSRDVVSAVELGETVAVFERNSWGYGGTLTWSNGRCAEFKGKRQGWWTMQWTWYIDNEPLLHFNSKYSWVETKDQVDIVAANLPPDDIALLLTFGWYLLMKKTANETNAALAGAAGG